MRTRAQSISEQVQTTKIIFLNLVSDLVAAQLNCVVYNKYFSIKLFKKIQQHSKSPQQSPVLVQKVLEQPFSKEDI
jgi:hypothetical protein